MTVYSFEDNPLMTYNSMKMRDNETKQKAFAFHLDEIAKYLAYELSKNPKMPRRTLTVTTPTGYDADGTVLNNPNADLKILTNYRAGIPLATVMGKVLGCDVGFADIGRDEKTLEAIYRNENNLDAAGKVALYVDTMIAHLCTFFELRKRTRAYGDPKSEILICDLISQYAVDMLQEKLPELDIYATAVDKHTIPKEGDKPFMGPGLSGDGWIIPGLGDAGDRLYGKKHKKKPSE